MPIYEGNLADLFRARKLKKKGARTCFLLLRFREPENTTIETTEIVGVYSSLELAEEGKKDAWDGEIIEFVMDPPVIDTNGRYPTKKVMSTASSRGPDWWEEYYDDSQAEDEIRRDERE